MHDCVDDFKCEPWRHGQAAGQRPDPPVNNVAVNFLCRVCESMKYMHP